MINPYSATPAGAQILDEVPGYYLELRGLNLATVQSISLAPEMLSLKESFKYLVLAQHQLYVLTISRT